VESAVRYFREQVPVVRRRYGGHVAEEHAEDVIAAEYRHTPARGVSGAQAPDPQLHSHVVISGAVREDTQHAHITDLICEVVCLSGLAAEHAHAAATSATVAAAYTSPTRSPPRGFVLHHDGRLSGLGVLNQSSRL
jgi:TrwC relaxase